jgi:hypothetical protein
MLLAFQIVKRPQVAQEILLNDWLDVDFCFDDVAGYVAYRRNTQP